MITGFYAGILALFFTYLSFQVIKYRRKHRVSLGDGGIDELQQAISAHNNAAQYLPISLLLLFMIEYQAIHWVAIHTAGILLCVGRFCHALGLVQTDFKKRTLGMKLTITVLLALAALNILWPLYQLVLTFSA